MNNFNKKMSEKAVQCNTNHTDVILNFLIPSLVLKYNKQEFKNKF